MQVKLLARYKAYSLAISYLKENENITKEVPAFATTYAVAKATLDAITENENRRQQKGRSITLQKEQLQENLVNQAQAIAAIIGGYATNQKDANLLESVNFSASDLRYVSGQVLSSRCANILALARELAVPLKEYGVTEALLTNLANLTGQYSNDVLAPRRDRTDRKNAGTEIRELMQELDIIFKNQLDAMMMLFRFTHRSFYNGYLMKREIQLPGSRKTRLEGQVLDKTTGQALEGVEVSVDDTDLNLLTGADGSYDLKLPLLSGSLVQFKKTGYKTAERTFSLRRGKATRLEVEMEKG